MNKLSDIPRLADFFERFAVPDANARRVSTYYTGGHSRDTTDDYNRIERTIREHLWYSLDFVRECVYNAGHLIGLTDLRQHIYGYQTSLRDKKDLRKDSAKVLNRGLRSRYYTQTSNTRMRKDILNSLVMRISGFLKENIYRNFLWQI